MGTDLEIVALADAPEAAIIALDVLRAWDARFSRFRPDSELSRLNAAAGWPVAVTQEMLAVVGAALDAARATDGLFDPTLLPHLLHHGYDRTFLELPADAPAPAGPPPRTGAWREIELDAARGTIRLPVDAGLDLGGIAKGMAVDAAVAAIVAAGIEVVAVSAGGDLAVAGTPPGGDAWLIALDETGPEPIVVALASGALCTSSVTRRRWVRGGQARHHLLDPRTGEPATSDLRAVTVLAGDARQAEVAAKVALLLGSVRGGAFLAARGLDGLLVSLDGATEVVGPWTRAEAAA